MSKYKVGIDLGTSNTVCCSFNNNFEFIKIKRGYILPSVLMYKDGEIKVGDAAKQRVIRYPDNVISSSKTYMGDFDKVWEIADRKFTPTDVASEILKEINKAAKKHFNTEETIQAVITVPAYFTSSQTDETRKAATNAGFEVIRIITEPMAAAIAYGLDESKENIFVVDIGGGTFDLCLLSLSKTEENEKKFSTVHIDGDSKLGGDDFDKVIQDMCYSYLRTQYAIDFSSLTNSGLMEEEYNQAKQKIKQKAEQAKVALSDALETDIDIANLYTKNDVPVNFRYTVTREAFEKASMPLFNKMKRIVTRFMDNAEIETNDIDKIILVGGSANIPYIRQFICEYFGKEPFADKDLAKLVAMGAAIYASKNDTLVSTKLIIEDILSHSLGIEVKGERFSPILNAGEKYPIARTQVYETVYDYQKCVNINVYEGECKENIHNNTFYGGFVLDNIRQGVAGVPIQVNFEMHEDRTLHITAWDESTGARETKTITINKGKRV